MDGAGRLARSQRPQADLRAAALGAAILLREYAARRFARARATRNRSRQIQPQVQARQAMPAPPLERTPSARLVALVERYLPHRLGTFATVVLLCGSAWLGIV